MAPLDESGAGHGGISPRIKHRYSCAGNVFGGDQRPDHGPEGRDEDYAGTRR